MSLLDYLWSWIYPQPPPPQEPWRQSSTWDIETLTKEVMKEDEGKQINLLLLGPVGAGKSSFINSILSIDKKRQCGMASTHDGTTETWTKTLGVYHCKNLRLFDYAGLAQRAENGFLTDDLLFLINGNLMEGCKFDQAKTIDQNVEGGKRVFNDKPGLDDQMHCIIFFVDSTSINATLSKELQNQIERLQAILCEQHIPRMLVLTKVDKLCGEVANDIKNVFWSRNVQTTVKRASELFGIEEASIHPIKNYVNDFDILNKMSIPLLIALRQAKHYAEDRIEYVLQHREGT